MPQQEPVAHTVRGLGTHSASNVLPYSVFDVYLIKHLHGLEYMYLNELIHLKMI
jgi:hypothetical protein